MNDVGLYQFRKNLRTRYDRDHIISAPLAIILVLIPLIYYIILRYVLFARYYELVYEARLLQSIAFVMTLFIYVVIAYSLYSRLASHAKRDTDWRESLIAFADSEGADTTELRRLHEGITSRDRFQMLPYLNALVLVMIVCSTIAIIFSHLPDEIIFTMILRPAFAVLLIATPSNILYPHRHEIKQIEFTRELKTALEPVGINISEMPAVIKTRSTSRTIELMILTLGTYVFYVFVMMFINMNHHIRYQHSYERVLLAQLEGRDVELKIDTKGGFIRQRRKPKELIVAELFLMGICLMYLMRISGVALDLINDRTNVTIIKNLGLEEVYQGGMLLTYIFLMLLAIFAMIGIESGRVLSWRKVVRSCILFLVPVFSSIFIYNSSSYTHMFDFNPYISLATVYGIILLMILSIPIRRYYTPVGKKMPEMKKWVKFVFGEKLFPDEDENEELFDKVIYAIK
ncbi:MAG: hypothetical protein IJ248_07725 [Candidatus Methanomethylophilaceae archaeon]|nr:hypothetical protein [Candidatus Methanomethylophilaceae archaeon]